MLSFIWPKSPLMCTKFVAVCSNQRLETWRERHRVKVKVKKTLNRETCGLTFSYILLSANRSKCMLTIIRDAWLHHLDSPCSTQQPLSKWQNCVQNKKFHWARITSILFIWTDRLRSQRTCDEKGDWVFKNLDMRSVKSKGNLVHDTQQTCPRPNERYIRINILHM